MIIHLAAKVQGAIRTLVLCSNGLIEVNIHTKIKIGSGLLKWSENIMIPLK
jgi:hypothetical protein